MYGRLIQLIPPWLCVVAILLASCGKKEEQPSATAASSGAAASMEQRTALEEKRRREEESRWRESSGDVEVSAAAASSSRPQKAPATDVAGGQSRANVQREAQAALRRLESEEGTLPRFESYAYRHAYRMERDGETASTTQEQYVRAAPPPPSPPPNNGTSPSDLPDSRVAASQVTTATNATGGESASIRPSGPLPIWNLWMEKRKDPFQPVITLAPDTTYVVRLHLGPFSYGREEDGVATQKVSSSTDKALDQWYSNLSSSEDKVEVQAFLIYDATYFKPPGQVWRTLTINVRRLKTTLGALSAAGAADPFAKLRSEGEPPFVYGEVSFELRTKSAADLPAVPQAAAIAISLWDPDKNKPLDEVSFGVCMQGTKCDGVKPIRFGLGGLDTLRASLGDSASQPEVALHLIQMADSGMRGVLRERKGGEFKSWSLSTDLVGLQRAIDNALDDLTSVNEKGRAEIGDALLGTFFPIGEKDAREARTAFVDAVTPYMQGAAYERDDLPAVFFRVAGLSYLEPSLWPLSFISVPVSSVGEKRHLGRYFRVESPLAVQNFDAVDACIANWIVVGPTSSGSTAAARAKLEYIGMGDDSQPVLEVGKVPVSIIDDMSQFGNLVRGAKGTASEQTELETREGTLVTVLSHHHRDRIYFEQNLDPIYATQVKRRFTSPSVVLLQGCGTGQPGASGFIKQLNQRGFYAAVATLKEIEAPMAGDYFNCFIKQFDDAPQEGRAIGILHTRAQRCLESGLTPWGSKALLFSLLGNSGLKICRPRLPG